MKLLDIWKKIGKQPLQLTQHKDAVVFVNGEKYEISGIVYDNGNFVGFEAKNDKQWNSKDMKPEIHRWVSVKDKDGEEYYDHQWDGHAWYAYARDEDGCDRWRSELEIIGWRYQG